VRSQSDLNTACAVLLRAMRLTLAATFRFIEALAGLVARLLASK
jgi:hypothetical protein